MRSLFTSAKRTHVVVEVMAMVVVEGEMTTAMNVIDQDTLQENATKGRNEAGAEEAAEDMEVLPLHK